MIAPLRQVRRRRPSPAWHEGFLRMLPAIRQHAHCAFRHLGEEAREECVAEAIANSMVAYVRLFEHGREALAYPTVLARYAVAQIHAGRRVGSRLNTKEVLAEVAQKRHGFVVKRLDRFDKDAGEWIEATVEDTRTPVPDQAAFRCDFPEWLATLPSRTRHIAKILALGHSTRTVARRYQVSDARISQMRAELRDSWLEFHGETDRTETASGAAA
jgi:hypothetical protein